MNHLKRLKTLVFAAISALSLWAAPVLAAGTTPLALVPQVDSTGNVAAGCLLYFYVAGTVSTPQNAYADFGLTQPLPNPVQCDQSGRVPMHWLADGLIHIRLTDSSGVQLVDTTMQVLGPSSGGGGGGGTVDPTTILATGDLKVKYGTGTLTGFVRCNGLTLGNAVSGATERANADTQALFIYLYGVDPNLVVSGGRSGNALTDYNANKTIALPDGRGRDIAFLDDMGNAAAGRYGTATFISGNATTLGSTIGGPQLTLQRSDLPNVAPTFTGNLLTVESVNSNIPVNATNSPAGGSGTTPIAATIVGQLASTGTPTGTVQSLNGGVAQTSPTTLPPSILATIYIKL